MALTFYNTLSRSLEEFKPLSGSEARLYTCGPTVYDFAHIGNFRAYVFEDLLRRALRFEGYRVIQVMNLTDVDDKTIRGSRAAGKSLRDYTEPFKRAFFEDIDALGIERAEHYPAATDHVPEMIALIRRLEERGAAYRSDDGSVYFNISKFPGYGRLGHIDLSGLKPGARVAQDEYMKENAADFALWKAWCEEDGDVAWDSPWGRGRPGWHIECSAMSMKYLGETFDLHTGGMDNMFPHHDDEIAQSEAATGKRFVNVWMHCAHLVVDGRKMSKSLGNFYSLRDLLKRGYSGRELRYALMAVHYRQALNFTFEALDAARAALGRLDEFLRRLRETAGNALPAAALPGWAAECRAGFAAAIRNDLNISGALASVFNGVHEGNRLMAAGGLAPADAAAALDMLGELDGVLGLLAVREDRPGAEAEALLAERAAVRKAKNWARSDEIRVRLGELGWVVQDTPGGSKLVRKAGT
ncbi:MAG: cysteine--tRNA ligase [Lentisphaerae bacterium]|nr:cysteine--tRNA ligase [Lentisphaerota bacterium]